MCGIGGTVGFGDAGLTQALVQALRHRGPDDQGAFDDPPAHLGMARLSIIDLAGGHQPMQDESGRYRVVFNGEIYNHLSLREDLERRGHRFASRADTEVIVHLFEDRGPDCVEALRGDFALAVWDRAAERLFLARDRLGVKPLYYWHRGDRFAFASELKALLAVPEISRDVDPAALDAYLSFQYVPAPATIFADVRKLPAATWLVFERGAVRTGCYWRPPPPAAGNARGGPADEEVRGALAEAVKLRLMSDVPLGAFLSGGIDSSLVVALMRRESSGPVRTFSIGFEPPDDDFNELPDARIAARAFETDHREFIVRPDAAALLPRVAWQMDEPFADSSALITLLIAREARRHVTVALTGIGGDEVFGGYPRYLGLRVAEAYDHVPRLVRRALERLGGRMRGSGGRRDFSGWAGRFLREGTTPRLERYLRWRTYFTEARKHELYSQAFRDSLGSADACAGFRAILESRTGPELDRANALDLLTYLPDDLLAMGDKMSMAWGLEVRVPFCDHRVVELASAVPMRQRLSGFRLKALLKRAARGLLPPALLSKPKQGFMIPLTRWLREDLSGLCRELLSPEQVARRGWFRPEAVTRLIELHQSRQANLAQQLYALLMLELWARRYLDRSS
ncbi:MAG TPA: asparagine synthase (glutamine-hydrolyzing) [bacterium]